MSEQNKNQDEDLRKSLQGIGFSEAEIDDILKSEESAEKEKEGSEEDETEDEKEAKAKQKEMDDEAEKSLKAKEDLEKSLQSTLEELKNIKGKLNKLNPKVEKSEIASDELVKSFNAKTDGLEKSFGELKEEFTASLSDITKSLGELKASIETIGENSKGMKGHQFSNFIQKGGETRTEDGKTIVSIKDKDTLIKSLNTLYDKSEGSEKESLGSSLMNLEGSGILDKTAIMALTKNNIEITR